MKRASFKICPDPISFHSSSSALEEKRREESRVGCNVPEEVGRQLPRPNLFSPALQSGSSRREEEGHSPRRRRSPRRRGLGGRCNGDEGGQRSCPVALATKRVRKVDFGDKRGWKSRRPHRALVVRQKFRQSRSQVSLSFSSLQASALPSR